MSENVKNSENVSKSSDVYTSRSVDMSRDVYMSSDVYKSSDVDMSHNVNMSSNVYKSIDVRLCENILYCFGIKLKEFFVFNKQVTTARFIELKELNYEIFNGYRLKITKWVKEEDMTDEEKEDNSEFYTLGYKEAWALCWAELPQERKDKLFAIPEFDSEVFKQITGLDVQRKDDEIEKAIKLLEAKGRIKDGKIVV